MRKMVLLLLLAVVSLTAGLPLQGASLSCSACTGITGKLIKAIAGSNITEKAAIDLIIYYCYEVKKEEDQTVCDGVVREFGQELFAVVRGGVVVEEGLVCSALSFCPPPPGRGGLNVTFPKPKPPFNPPSYPLPSSDSYDVIQISDIHFEHQYEIGSSAVCGEPTCCITASPKLNGTYPAREFGEYTCDLAPLMLDSVLDNLKDAGSSSKILLWTGDTPPHVLWTENKEIIKNDTLQVTQMIKNSLPQGIVVVPSIGNHESFPVNNFAEPSLGLQDWLYSALGEAWGPFIPADAAALLSQKGYFAMTLPPATSGGKELKIISLQTNYCNNLAFWLYLNDTDPGNQLQWLIQELQASEDAGQAVWISGHIAPSNADCRPEWAANLVKILNRYEATVVGQFYGHTHKDQYALDYVGTRPSGVQYYCPSVTTVGGINPSWRVYQISPSSHQVVNFIAHRMNLEKTYATNATEPIHEVYYVASEAYNLTDLSPKSWDALAHVFETDDSAFQLYYDHYYTGTKTAPCEGACKESLLCEIFSSSSGLYKNCTKAAPLPSLC